MTLLANPHARLEPWPHLVFDRALAEPQLHHLDQLFEQASAWQQHRSSLYDGAMCDMSEQLDGALRSALIARMQRLLDLPLTDRVQVNVQRMAPGEDVRVHSDRPLLGYEVARLVVQLNADWVPAHGGLLRLHGHDGPTVGAPTPEPPTAELPPTRNSAVAFVLSDASFHSVSTTHRERRSVVFYFWHRGNDAGLARQLHALYDGMRFAQLPERVQGLLDEADASADADRTRRAAMVAWALHRWGHDEARVERAFRASAWPATEDPAAAEPDTHLARWAADVFEAGFDAARWKRLRDAAAAYETDGARGLWSLAFA